MPAPFWIANAALAVACGLAGFALYGAVIAPSEPRLPRPGAGGAVAGDASQAPARASFTPLSLEDLPQTRSRPAFAPDRRPVAEEETAQAVARPEALNDLVLAGVVLSDGGGSAWLRPSPAAKAEPVRTGERVQGWTLAAVAADHVRLSSEGRTVRIDLRPQDEDSPGTANGTQPRAAIMDQGKPDATVLGFGDLPVLDGDVTALPRMRNRRTRTRTFNGVDEMREN